MSRHAFRNFRCQNQRCAKPFTDFVEVYDGTVKFNGREIHFTQLPCPFCAVKNAKIILPEYHRTVAKGVANGIDSGLRQIADKHGLTNMNNSGGKAAIPMMAEPPPMPTAPQGAPMYSPAPGFSVPYTGGLHAGWSNAPPQASVKAKTNEAVRKSSGALSSKVAGG